MLKCAKTSSYVIIQIFYNEVSVLIKTIKIKAGLVFPLTYAKAGPQIERNNAILRSIIFSFYFKVAAAVPWR